MPNHIQMEPRSSSGRPRSEPRNGPPALVMRMGASADNGNPCPLFTASPFVPGDSSYQRHAFPIRSALACSVPISCAQRSVLAYATFANRLTGGLSPRLSLSVPPEYPDLNFPCRRNSGRTSCTKSFNPVGTVAGNTLNPSAAH